VAELAQRCPALLSMCTTELDPSSWLSVAWYPIYRIPTGRTLRDLHACFLTFHALIPPNQPGASPRQWTVPSQSHAPREKFRRGLSLPRDMHRRVTRSSSSTRLTWVRIHGWVWLCRPEGRFAAARQRCPAPPPRSEGAEAMVAQRVAACEARLGPKQAPDGCVALSPFGFAAYKMRAEVWASKDKSAAAPHEAMYNQARFFLSQRNLRHPDFEFFLQR